MDCHIHEIHKIKYPTNINDLTVPFTTISDPTVTHLVVFTRGLVIRVAADSDSFPSLLIHVRDDGATLLVQYTLILLLQYSLQHPICHFPITHFKGHHSVSIFKL